MKAWAKDFVKVPETHFLLTVAGEKSMPACLSAFVFMQFPVSCDLEWVNSDAC